MKPNVSQEIFFRELEEKLLLPEVRKSPDELITLLANNFVEYGSSGRIYTKQDVIEVMQKESTAIYSISNFHERNLSNKIVLVTYTATNATTGESSLRSSIWQLNSGQWQIVFHQGTPIAK